MGMLRYIVFVIVCAFISQAMADEAGLKLAHQVYHRPDGNDTNSRITMSLVEEGKQARVRQLYFYRSYRGRCRAFFDSFYHASRCEWNWYVNYG